MRPIETIAPIPLDQLKEYFIDKEILFLVKYDESNLKGEQLLTYLSNLEIPSDILFKDMSDLYKILEIYLRFDRIVEIPILNHFMIEVLLEYRGLLEKAVHHDFIQKNREELDIWAERLDSLTLFNFYTVESPKMKSFVESHEKSRYDNNTGINFVQLLNEPLFYEFYRKVDKNNLKYFPTYFNDRIFNGKPLYEYWANRNNPLFMVNLGVLTNWGQDIDIKESVDDTPIQ